ncbi:MAG: hypothetical protein R2861_04680 [Desulfobacterales bacterium]
MLRASALGIAVILEEGRPPQTWSADVVCVHCIGPVSFDPSPAAYRHFKIIAMNPLWSS